MDDKVAVSAISYGDPSQDQPNDHDRVSSQSTSSRQGQKSLAIERRFSNDAEHTRQSDNSALAGSVGNDTRSQAVDDAGSDLVDARHLTFVQPHLETLPQALFDLPDHLHFDAGGRMLEIFSAPATRHGIAIDGVHEDICLARAQITNEYAIPPPNISFTHQLCQNCKKHHSVPYTGAQGFDIHRFPCTVPSSFGPIAKNSHTVNRNSYPPCAADGVKQGEYIGDPPCMLCQRNSRTAAEYLSQVPDNQGGKEGDCKDGAKNDDES